MSKDRKPGKDKDQSSEAAPDPAALADAVRGFTIEGDLSPLINGAAYGSGHYPYERKPDEREYEKDLAALQVELLKMQDWVRTTGERVVILFEGRDTAGKDGAILRFTQHLNPRTVRVVALSKPSDVEAGQWYFQRYIEPLPTKGEIVIFDRSWYNRAGVEPVMGFCKPEDTAHFMHEVPVFESMLVRDGIRLFKLFLTIGHEMQLKRLHDRYRDPLKRWKLSPVDFQAMSKWDDYSQAFEAMLRGSDSHEAPWTIIKANDKLRTRLAVIRRVLYALPYKDKDATLVGQVDPRIVLTVSDYLAAGGED